MRGLPLNKQLRERGGRFLEEQLSAPRYRLFAFTDGPLEKPGMVRAAEGISVPLELWDLPEDGWASFLALIPHPLGLGKVELADGRWVTGFLMEASHQEQSRDIGAFGGWRDYLASHNPAAPGSRT
jgi:allophanate hydrolase